MTRIARNKEGGCKCSVFRFQKFGSVCHGLLTAERGFSFRVIRVFRGCSNRSFKIGVAA